MKSSTWHYVFEMLDMQFGRDAVIAYAIMTIFQWITAAVIMTLVLYVGNHFRFHKKWMYAVLFFVVLSVESFYAYEIQCADLLRFKFLFLALLLLMLILTTMLFFQETLLKSMMTVIASRVMLYVATNISRIFVFSIFPSGLSEVTNYVSAIKEIVVCILALFLTLFLLRLFTPIPVRRFPVWVWTTFLSITIVLAFRSCFEKWGAIQQNITPYTDYIVKPYYQVYWISRLMFEELSITFLCVVAFFMRIFSREHEKMQRQIDRQTQELARMQEDYRAFTIQRHDMINQLFCIQSLLQQNEPEKAGEYLETLTKDTLSGASSVHSASAVINAVIHAKQNDTNRLHIRFSCQITAVIPESMEYDVSLILCNLIDNAIEACKLQKGTPEILLSVSETDGYYRIVIKNTIESSVISINSAFRTTKSDASLHGIGLHTVRSLVSKHEGMIDFYEKENWFVACVMLMK